MCLLLFSQQNRTIFFICAGSDHFDHPVPGCTEQLAGHRDMRLDIDDPGSIDIADVIEKQDRRLCHPLDLSDPHQMFSARRILSPVICQGIGPGIARHRDDRWYRNKIGPGFLGYYT